MQSSSVGIGYRSTIGFNGQSKMSAEGQGYPEVTKLGSSSHTT